MVGRWEMSAALMPSGTRELPWSGFGVHGSRGLGKWKGMLQAVIEWKIMRTMYKRDPWPTSYFLRMAVGVKDNVLRTVKQTNWTCPSIWEVDILLLRRECRAMLCYALLRTGPD